MVPECLISEVQVLPNPGSSESAGDNGSTPMSNRAKLVCAHISGPSCLSCLVGGSFERNSSMLSCLVAADGAQVTLERGHSRP